MILKFGEIVEVLNCEEFWTRQGPLHSLHQIVYLSQVIYITDVKKSCLLFNVNEGLGLLKFADISLILINPSPSNVKKQKCPRCVSQSKFQIYTVSTR